MVRHTERRATQGRPAGDGADECRPLTRRAHRRRAGVHSVRTSGYPVQSLLELLSSGMTIEDVLADYPDLEREDLLAALEFGALTVGGHRVVPPGTA